MSFSIGQARPNGVCGEKTGGFHTRGWRGTARDWSMLCHVHTDGFNAAPFHLRPEFGSGFVLTRVLRKGFGGDTVGSETLVSFNHFERTVPT